MESTLEKPGVGAAKNASKATAIAYWIVTAIFAFLISFTAYAGLRMPNVAQAFIHLGFPAYFRVEISWAKFLGIATILAPVPPRLKEWAYAGFAFDLSSAVYSHLSVGDGIAAWGWAAGIGILGALSYFFWRRLQTRVPAAADH